MVQKKSKMTKNSNQGGPALKDSEPKRGLQTLVEEVSNWQTTVCKIQLVESTVNKRDTGQRSRGRGGGGGEKKRERERERERIERK